MLLPLSGKSMSENSAYNSSNRLLAALSASDFALLQPHLTTVTLKLLQNLERPGEPIEHIYFMHTAIASVVATVSGEPAVEIGLIGREGMTGAAVVLGNGQSPHSTYVQAAGFGDEIAVSTLRNVMGQSKTLHQMFLKFLQSFMVQTAHTAIANARASVPERLARWLLMAQDRMDGPKVPMTHEFLGLMLGVRRAGVTDALHDLSERQMIQARRGEVAILDRGGLRTSCRRLLWAPRT